MSVSFNFISLHRFSQKNELGYNMGLEFLQCAKAQNISNKEL